jgi:hypothetical protein
MEKKHMPEKNSKIFGVLAQFDSAGSLLKAAHQVHDAGYQKYDCHSPFPIHGMDTAMRLKRSPLGYLIGAVAATALTGITLFIYWTSAVDYPLVISGKPYFSYQAFVPVIFAVTILLSAITATLGMMALNQLPKLFHPLFNSPQFSKVTNGGFFVSIEANDPLFDQARTTSFLQSIGATQVEVVGEE